MRRWIGGGWQNLLKHWKIVLRRPGHALEISLVYVEGMVFGLLFFILPIINVTYFLHFFIGYFTVAMVIGAYAAIKRRRFDLLLYAPLFPLLLIINSMIFFEQFIKEIILRKKDLHWFKPERRVIPQ
jgi:hypothetical protein